MPRRLRPFTLPALPPPFAAYSHAVHAPAGARWLATSGQLGVAADGAIPEDVEAQAELCFDALRALLAEARMTPADVVRLNAFVTAREHFGAYGRARDRFVAEGAPPGERRAPPASTLVIVSGFTRPEFKVEVELLAARFDEDGA